MLTADEFNGLQEGDLVETAPMLKGLTDEKIVLHTLRRTETTVTLMATLFGVSLGEWTATLKEGEVTWQTA